MRYSTKLMSVLAVVLLTVTTETQGGPSVGLLVEGFQYYWDFDAPPTIPGDPVGFDLYHNGTGAVGGDVAADFLHNTGAAPTWSNGVLTLPNGTNVFSQLWPVAPSLNVVTGYTLEYRLRATNTSGLGVAAYATPEGTSGVGGFSLVNNAGQTEIYHGYDSAGQASHLRASLDSDEFVTLRVAVNFDPNVPGGQHYTFFVNGKRAGTDMGSANSLNLDRLVFGDLGSHHAGSLEVDHMGFTAGAFAPERTNHPDFTKFTLNGAGDPVVRPSDGALMTVVRSTVGAGTRTSFLTSNNDGLTWQSVGIMGTGNGQPGEVAGGMLLQLDPVDPLSYVYIYRDPNSYSAVWDHGTHQPLPTASYDMWSIRSDDGGVTWKDQQMVLDGYNGAFINSIVTTAGTVVAPLADFDTVNGRGVVRTYYSNDKGETWQQSNLLDIADAGVYAYGSEDGLMEPTITQRADGSLYMLLRTTQGYFYQTESFDEGQTWATPTQSTIDASNSPGYLITLTDGRIALIWNRLTPEFEDGYDNFIRNDIDYAPHASSQFREEVSLALSSDGGSSWTDPIVVSAQPGARLQYSRMFEREPGVIWMRIGGVWLSYDAGVLTIPGDLNGDGFVGIDDLNIVLGEWNASPPSDPAADPTGDDYVGIQDLNVVLGNWNAGTPPATSVPEPSMLGLAVLGAPALLRRCHTQRHV